MLKNVPKSVKNGPHFVVNMDHEKWTSGPLCGPILPKIYENCWTLDHPDQLYPPPWNSSYTLSPVAKDIQERSKNVIEAADENGSDSDEMVLRTPEKTSNAGDLSTHSTPTMRMLRLGSSPDVARNVQNNSTISAVEASPTYPKSSSTVLDITVVSSDDEVSATPAKRTRYDFYTSILEAKTPQATPKKPPRKRKPAKKAILSPVNIENGRKQKFLQRMILSGFFRSE